MVNWVSWSFAVLESWIATVVMPPATGPPDGPLLPQPVISRARPATSETGKAMFLEEWKKRPARKRIDFTATAFRAPSYTRCDCVKADSVRKCGWVKVERGHYVVAASDSY